MEKVEQWGRIDQECGEEDHTEVDIRPGGEEEAKRQKERKPVAGELIMYTDGSMREGRVGVGVWWETRRGEEMRAAYLGTKMEVFDAEMFAIWMALKEGIKVAHRDEYTAITIRADNQEAMRRVTQSRASHGEMMAQRIRTVTKDARRMGMTVKLEWVHSHVGIRGNEKADEAAKLGTTKTSRHRGAFTSTAFVSRASKQELTKEWEDRWEVNPRKGKNYGGGPRESRRWKFDSSQRTQHVTISRLRTGHIRCDSYLSRIGKRATAECQCGAAKQDVAHILLRCRFTHDSRTQAQRDLRAPNLSMRKLLYTPEGAEGALRIWGEFEKMRHQFEQGGDEDAEREAAEEEWGYGELEAVEAEGRMVNGEAALAERGYGE